MNVTAIQHKNYSAVGLPRFYLSDKRKELKISVDELTIKLGIGRKYYYLIESGNRGHRMSLELILGLISHLQFDALDLLQREQEYLDERKKYIKKQGRRSAVLRESNSPWKKP